MYIYIKDTTQGLFDVYFKENVMIPLHNRSYCKTKYTVFDFQDSQYL